LLAALTLHTIEFTISTASIKKDEIG
jgi:hypothetical protein